MNSVWRRTLSVVVVVPLLLWIIHAGGLVMLLAIMGFYLLGAHEWSYICQTGGSIPVSWLNFFGGLPILAVAYSGHLNWLFPVMAVLLAVNLIIPPFIGLSAGTVGMDLFGQVYIALPLAYLLLLRQHGFLPTLSALVLVWSSDIAAYFAGSLLGRHKLSPRLSPKKTWEGLIAGFIASALVGALMVPPLLHRPLGFGLMVGAAGGILSVFGDLGESAIKRWAQTKDSGSFMPGHGGLLDRIDSLLFALPALYYLLR